MSEGLRYKVRAADEAGVRAAAKVLREGGLVAFPTETVYGLGADARNDRAVAAIFEAKGRPRFNPLIVHFRHLAAAAEETVFDSRARALAERFWPGPLSLVLPRAPGSRISLLCSAGLDTLAVRVPGHESAQALLNACALPIAAPSANPAGRISPTRAADVVAALGERVDLVLDGGPCPIGLESTVVDMSGAAPRLLRPGAVTREELEVELETLESGEAEGPLRAPGQLASHYAPEHPLLLDALRATQDQALLAFGPNPPRGAARTLNLSVSGDLREAAANLFAFLRALDEAPVSAIAVMPIPSYGLGAAINDRLARAAAPRDA